jgi:uncharacterized protein (UPF0276 family)
VNNYTYPVVGLLYNPMVPYVIDEAGDLVQYLAVIPERYRYDLDTETDPDKRFRPLHEETDTLKTCAEGRIVAGHGIALSLPSAVPLDRALLDQNARLAADLGFSWYSEHLSMFLMPHADVPNAQAGIGLPVVYDEETFDIMRDKLEVMDSVLGCPILLENGSIFTPIPEMEMTEPQFFNRLYREANCGTLLDLHNLYVTYRHGNVDPEKYLSELDPDAVLEIHVAGGDELQGYYTDSHSRFAPDPVWSWAREFVPGCKNLRAITFEFHESYFERLGAAGIAGELERMHELAESCSPHSDVTYA